MIGEDPSSGIIRNDMQNFAQKVFLYFSGSWILYSVRILQN